MEATVSIRGSRIQIVLNGEGTFEEASAKTREMQALLRAQFGDAFRIEGAIEQHRPEIPHAHIVQRAKQEQGE